MIVCRLCLIASNDVIHIFREVGIQLKVSSILSKHFGSLFEVTEEHDEAICGNCWAHTDSFHEFYQRIKSAQNCYSSEDEEDGFQPDGSEMHPQSQPQPQNVKIIMYDSATNEIIEERHIGGHTVGHHQSSRHLPHQQQQQYQQQHGESGSAGYETFEVCEQTNDSSDMDLMMMMQPNETASGVDDNGHSNHLHDSHNQHDMQHVDEHGMPLDANEIDEDDDDEPEQDLEHELEDGTQQQQSHHQQSLAAATMDTAMANAAHRNDNATAISDYLHNNEHITVIEVSSPSQAQKLLLQQQQQQQLQMQQQQQQQHIQQQPSVRQPAQLQQQRLSNMQFATTSAEPIATPNAPPESLQVMRKRKMPTTTIAVLNPPAVGTIVQRTASAGCIDSVGATACYADLSEPESPPDTPNTSHDSSGALLSSTGGNNSSGSAGGGLAGGEPYRMQCDLCSKTFKTFHRVQSHYQMKHNMNGYVMCCGDQFFEKDLLVDHILMHVNNRRQMKKISCAHCEQFFYRKRFYTRHLLKVHNVGPNGNGSEPDSPVQTVAPGDVSATSPPADAINFDTTTVSSSGTSRPTIESVTVLPPKPTQIIRRAMSSSTNRSHISNANTVPAAASTPVVTYTSTNAGSRMPSVVAIQSIASKIQRNFVSASTSASAQQQQQHQQQTTIVTTTDNGADGGSPAAAAGVKYELSDIKDELLILES